MLAMTSIAILVGVLALLAVALLCEWAEKKSRKFYTDQALLRASGFCIGAALTAALFGILS